MNYYDAAQLYQRTIVREVTTSISLKYYNVHIFQIERECDIVLYRVQSSFFNFATPPLLPVVVAGR